MSKYSNKPYSNFVGNVKVELDLFNYATKSNVEKAKDVDTSEFAKSSLKKLSINYISLN